MARIFKPANTPGRKSGHRSARPKATVTLEIVDLADDGRGVARSGNKVIFVEGALPGEAVTAVIDHCGRRFDESHTLDILKPAPERVRPPCDHYGRCGGCQVQHLQYEAQVGWKQRRLGQLLNQLGADIAQEAPMTAEPWAYRHRARLAFRYRRDEGLVVGFRERSSHDIVDLKHCPLLQPTLSANIQPVVVALAELLKPMGEGDIVLCAGADGRLAVAVAGRQFPGQALCESIAGGLEGLASLARVAGKGKVWLNPNNNFLFYQLDSSDSSFQFTAGDFTQANPAVNAQLVGCAAGWLAPAEGKRIADFFCGLGNFSLPLARQGALVAGYELEAGMVERAGDNAQRLGLDTLRFQQADLFAPHAELVKGLDGALLDPPRAGARALCELLAASGVPRIVYVSCEPATLARDAAVLLAGGYRIARAAIADMFPHTRHLESILLFEHVR